MTGNTVRITSEHFDALRDYLLSDYNIESAAFLIAGFFQNNYGSHFTVRDILIPQDDDYNIRSEIHLEISPLFFNKAISRAERTNTTVIQCHSHPSSTINLQYSQSDFAGESLSSKTVYSCLGKKPMGSMLFGRNSIMGRIWLSPDTDPVKLKQIRIVDRHMHFQQLEQTNPSISYNTGQHAANRSPRPSGIMNRLRFLFSHNSKIKQEDDIDEARFDRQIRAFGLKGQDLLSRLDVGIVGTGGTGSAVAEQLARAGVKKFTLVDHDRFSKSNMTRLYGSYADTTNLHKVHIVRDNIRRIEPRSTVRCIANNVISQSVLANLKNCDIVFGCTDRHTPRSVLNELAYQFFIPVIDMGVGLDTANGRISGGSVRVTLCSPSLPCLYCIGIISPDQLLAESLSKSERESRQMRGYIPQLDDDVPSVIELTTLAASYAIFVMKDLLFNIMESSSNMMLVDIKSMQTTMLAASIKEDCVCATRRGTGDYIPLSAP